MKFIKKHKKLTICICVLLLLIITIVILVFTLFSLKDVELELKTQTLNLTQDVQDEIVSKTLENKQTVLFMNKQAIQDDLEKQFPYLKIVNIETKFPNKLVVHCTEREELFAVVSNGKTYFLDEDLKILRVSSEIYTKIENGPVVLTFKSIKIDGNSILPVTLDLNLDEAKEGMFLSLENEGSPQSFSNQINSVALSVLTAFEQNNRTLSDVSKQFSRFEIYFDSFTLSGQTSWHMCFKLVDKNNFETNIIDPSENLSQKISTMFEAFSTVSKNPSLLSKKLFVYENSNNEFAFLFE